LRGLSQASISRLVRRRIGLAVVTLLVLLIGSVAAAGCALSAPTWRGPPTDHFDGKKFKTPGSPDREGISGFFKWQLKRESGVWSPYRDEPAGPPPPHHVEPGQMRVTFINHATTLIQLDGFNVLTDPIYSARASPFTFAGPHRVRPPGIKFEDLPPIHAIVLSHNHYDHMNIETLRRVQTAFPHVEIFAGLGNRPFLESQGLKQVHELDWGQSLDVGELKIRSVKNQHFSNRGLFDNDGTLWTAWVLEGPKAGKAYFAGDTGYGPHFKEVGAAHGPFRLAVLPVGAYKPEYFMGPIHQDPKEAVDAAFELQARTSVPMHYGTFELADEGETEAIDELKKAMEARPGSGFIVLGFGEGRELP
jgi:L-ascorbate metabolism protein UlaG (beta-lactamase superfamily)